MKTDLPKGYFPIWLVTCIGGIPELFATHAKPRGGFKGGHTYIDRHGSRLAWSMPIGYVERAPVHPYGVVGMSLTEKAAQRMLEEYRAAARAYHLEQAAKLSPPPPTPGELYQRLAMFCKAEAAEPTRSWLEVKDTPVAYHITFPGTGTAGLLKPDQMHLWDGRMITPGVNDAPYEVVHHDKINALCHMLGLSDTQPTT